jgi:hypothetical protein
MAILAEDSAEKIMSVHEETFDLNGFSRLRPTLAGMARR